MRMAGCDLEHKARIRQVSYHVLQRANCRVGRGAVAGLRQAGCAPRVN